jgi:hypothetical protein
MKRVYATIPLDKTLLILSLPYFLPIQGRRWEAAYRPLTGLESIYYVFVHCMMFRLHESNGVWILGPFTLLAG